MGQIISPASSFIGTLCRSLDIAWIVGREANLFVQKFQATGGHEASSPYKRLGEEILWAAIQNRVLCANIVNSYSTSTRFRQTA